MERNFFRACVIRVGWARATEEEKYEPEGEINTEESGEPSQPCFSDT